MRGKLIKLNQKEITTADGKKFSKLEYVVRIVLDDRGTTKDYKGSMNIEYARKYFNYCDITTKDAIGQEVDVKLAMRTYVTATGEERTVNYCKYLNFLRDGEVIWMPKGDEENKLDF